MPHTEKPPTPPRRSKLANSPGNETSRDAAPGEDSNYQDEAYRKQREAYGLRSHENYPAGSAQRKEDPGAPVPGNHPDGTPERRRRSQKPD